MSIRIDDPITIPSPKTSSTNFTTLFTIPAGFDPSKQNSIETGYFTLTMMPSVRCSHACPHCYLTDDERLNSPILSKDDIKQAIIKVRDYFATLTHIQTKVITFYWYGGEPTQLGLPYMIDVCQLIEELLPPSTGIYYRHLVITSLIKVDSRWFEFFEKWCGGYFQSSFDGVMRGQEYFRLWEGRVSEAIARGLRVGIISVVNNKLLKSEPTEIVDYLSNLGINDMAFVSLQRNERNKTKNYLRLMPTLTQYSDFLIAVMEAYYARRSGGQYVPEVGQAHFVLSRSKMTINGNVAGQTLFLMPNGDFSLPDYQDHYTEFSHVFGNILNQTFEEVLTSRERRGYLLKQYMGNHNTECQECPYKTSCLMEFWKENRPNDECFGARNFVKYLLERERTMPVVLGRSGLIC